MQINRIDSKSGNIESNKPKSTTQDHKKGELDIAKLQKLDGFNELQEHIDLSLKELERKHFSQKRDEQLAREKQTERVKLLNSKPIDN